jgi:prepilin-type N-terminal cleavage/methylation domain-containing protein
MRRSPFAGFTLIELLVVISILSLLAVTFVPSIVESEQGARQAADSRQLSQQGQWIRMYHQKLGRYPEGGGHQFILGPWIKDIVEHTPKNLDFYFTPGLRESDDHYHQLCKQDLTRLWPDLQSVTSADTHYAGRSAREKKGMESGTEAWMANDNEGGWSFADGSINVLYGDGTVRALRMATELKEQCNWSKEQGPFPVGPDSPHPQLKRLER